MMRKRVLAALLPAALASFVLPAVAKDGDPAQIAARQKFFGIENVDDRGNVKNDKVIFSWATNTTYAVSVLGRVILLDSYINRPELPAAPLDRRRTPFLPADLVALNPEAIFLGHGHGDHADNAAYIAKWTGATIYASEETCAAMQLDVARMASDPNLHNNGARIVPNADPVKCVAVVPAGSRPGGYDETRNPPSQSVNLDQLDSVACIRAFKFIHSGNAPVDPSFAHTPLANIGDPRYAGGTFLTQPLPPATPVTVTYPAMYPVGTSFVPSTANPASRVAGQMNTRTTGGVGGAITIFYHFTLRGGNEFSFAWVNSAGPATEGIGSDPGLVTFTQYNDPATPPAALDLARRIGNSLFDVIERLPETDVFFGSIVSLGATNNQQRDIIKVIQHLKPKVYYPGHVTDVAQAGSALYHKLNWRETALAMGFAQSDWPEFRAQIDPNDFAVPQVFSPKDSRWGKGSSSGSSCN
jgi:L-ascorbate metabolism protein UlaG (beta-lactamase superfamily)